MTRPTGSRPARPSTAGGRASPPRAADPGVAGNERLTALAGAVLLVLIGVEIATVASIRSLLSVHIFVGVLLAGPLAVKTASTGWRFLRYYTGNAAYRRKGPPRPFLRVLAPLLLLATLVEIGSGIALGSTRPGSVGPLLAVHHAGFLVFTGLVILHVLAYIRRVPGLIASDWRPDRAPHAPGPAQRLAVSLASLLLGALAAILVLPAFDAWLHW